MRQKGLARARSHGCRTSMRSMPAAARSFGARSSAAPLAGASSPIRSTVRKKLPWRPALRTPLGQPRSSPPGGNVRPYCGMLARQLASDRSSSLRAAAARRPAWSRQVGQTPEVPPGEVGIFQSLLGIVIPCALSVGAMRYVQPTRAHNLRWPTCPRTHWSRRPTKGVIRQC